MNVTAFMAVLDREWRVPPNMRLHFARDMEFGDLIIQVTGQWEAIDPNDPIATNGKVMTHTTRNIPSPLIEARDVEESMKFVRHMVFEAISELWMHELHEWVTHYGEHIVHPHPDGRDNFR